MPPVKGGAIETLINDIIEQNEKEKQLDITVVSVYDEKAEEESKKYSYSKFLYVKKNLEYYLTAFCVRIKNMLGKVLNTYNEVVLRKIRKMKFDYVVAEDGAFMSFENYLKYFDKDQMIVHFHHNQTEEVCLENVFSMYIGVSSFVANNFRKFTRIKDVRVLKNGIKTENFMKKTDEQERLTLREKLGFSKDDFIVMFCGRLIPEKGVLELAKAVNRIDKKNIKLMIIGSVNFGDNTKNNEYVCEIQNEIKASDGRIVVTGFVHNTEIFKYHQISDVGVLPSMWEDAAPLSLIEMQVSGLPIITTRSGGAPEYVAEDAIVIEKDETVVDGLKDGILRLYNDDEFRTKMSENARQNALRFSTENFYKDFINILRTKNNDKE
ncbi:MAG: glycosyltransferase family 4 protein [Clostridia bacterium]|nr:glycosyltransferase family 4 protein [Clostridia bacterium]